MGQITATRNLVAIKVVRHAGQWTTPENIHPDSKVHGANMGPIWGQQDPGGPHELCYLGSFNSARLSNAYIPHLTESSLVQIIACCLFGAQPLLEPMIHSQLHIYVQCNTALKEQCKILDLFVHISLLLVWTISWANSLVAAMRSHDTHVMSLWWIA